MTGRAADGGARRTRRDVLQLAIATAGCAAGLGPAWASGDPADTIMVPLDAIEPGQQVVTAWNGRRVFIRRRTPEEIAAARAVPMEELRDPERDEDRVINPEWLVVFGECTHAGCTPIKGLGSYGGWHCLCHGSQFDISGRVRRGPATANLETPPYRFTGNGWLELGAGSAPGAA